MKLNRDKAGSMEHPVRIVEYAQPTDEFLNQTQPNTNADTKVDDAQLSESPSPMSAVLPFLKQRIVLKIPSDISFLDRVLDYLNENLLKLGIAGPDDTEILVARDEAIVNAIKHGNKNDPSKKVKIVAEMNARGARFTIRDEGSGFSRESVCRSHRSAQAVNAVWAWTFDDQTHHGPRDT